jgi:hypothetical protein
MIFVDLGTQIIVRFNYDRYHYFKWVQGGLNPANFKLFGRHQTQILELLVLWFQPTTICIMTMNSNNFKWLNTYCKLSIQLFGDSFKEFFEIWTWNIALSHKILEISIVHQKLNKHKTMVYNS